MIESAAHNLGYNPRSTGAEDAGMAWRDRECKGCGQTFAPTIKNQQYCSTCTTQCRVPGCEMKVRARGYCPSHLLQSHPIPAIEPRGTRCGIEGCERHLFCKGYCRLHYDRVRFTGDVGAAVAKLRKARGQPCEVDGCEKPATGDGLCIRHYARRRRTGETGQAALLRRAMGDGYITETGYLKITIEGQKVFAHRYVMEQVLGRPLIDGENVHHKNGDRLDNREENLEIWISQQPAGQRVVDLVEHALRILKSYPEQLADEGYRLVPLESQEATDRLCGAADEYILGAISAGG